MSFRRQAASKNGEQDAPKRTDLNRYVTRGLQGSAGSLSHRKRVESLSFSANLMAKKAFSISAEIAYDLSRKDSRSLVRSSVKEGPAQRQSFREGLLDEQSKTMRRDVVEDSFDTPW